MFTLMVKHIALLLIATSVPVLAAPYDETFKSGNLSFHVVSSNAAEGNKAVITPSGLKKVNDPLTVEIEGELTKTIVEDLNGDNIPEVFLIATGAGSGSYGAVKAFSTNGGKSLTDIVIAEPNPSDMDGYMGHDEFEVVEGTFIRRFPVYKTGDSNANPTGGWRQFQYKLQPGEAAWQLRIDRVVSY